MVVGGDYSAAWEAADSGDHSAGVACGFAEIEARGHHETAHRAKQKGGQVFRYAIVTGRAERDITADLRGALVPVVTRDHASLTDPAEVGALLSAIDVYEGRPITAAAALKLAPLVFVRRGVRWSEFDLDGGEWRIPAERMKMKERHIVPLARQAVAILRELKELGELGEIVRAIWQTFSDTFNNEKAFSRVMSNLNLLRAPIVHCSPLADDEVVRLRLTVKDWFPLME